MVGTNTDSQVKGASSEPSFEVITQQIAYLMSAITNSTNQDLNKKGGCNGLKPNGNGKYPSTTFQRPKRDKKNMNCWGCGGSGHSWRECSTPKQGNNLSFRSSNQMQNRNDGQNLNGQ